MEITDIFIKCVEEKYSWLWHIYDDLKDSQVAD